VAQHAVQAGVNQGDDPLLTCFGSVATSMLTLFMTITSGNSWGDCFEPLYVVSGGLANLFYLTYVCLMTLCVMNVLVGIFCQSAIDTAAADQDVVISAQLQDKERFVSILKQLFYEWDETGKGTCSVEDFMQHASDDDTKALLRSLEIEVRDALVLFELLDNDGSGQVDLEEFVTGCITLRGGAKAVHIEKINGMSKIMSSKFDDMERKLNMIIREVSEFSDPSIS